MRRICLILLSTSLAVPALAGAALTAPAGEGSLAVTDGSGTLVIQGRGVIFGYFEQGTLLVVDYRPSDPTASLSVSGASAQTSFGVATYTGSGVRFLLPAGHYTIEIAASGIDVSAVGRGTAGVTAAAVSTTTSVGATPQASPPGGTIAVDGGRPVAFEKVSGPLGFGGAKTS